MKEIKSIVAVLFFLMLLNWSVLGLASDDSSYYTTGDPSDSLIDNPDKVTIEALKHLFDGSLKAWEAEKIKHNNSYSYKQKFSSWTGLSSIHRVKVKNGVIIERVVKSFKGGESVETRSFTEGPGEINTHSGVFNSKTMDQMYADCAGSYLTADPSQNKLSLRLSKENILVGCSYWPSNCMDDCLEGFSDIKIEWEE